MKNKYLPIFLSLLALPALAGCHHQEQPAPPAPMVQASVLLTQGWLALPAVPGHPGAAYFTLLNLTHKPAVVTSVAIDGVRQAEMHETTGGTMQTLTTLTIPGNGSVIFAPGTKHVMAFDLAPRLAMDGTTSITLGFADGSTLNAPLKIEPAGSMDSNGMGDMPGM